MKHLGLSLALLLAGAIGAHARIYEGSEAAALRCADMLLIAVVELENRGELPEVQRDVMLLIAASILDRHVSGTRQQKEAALWALRERRTPEQTLLDFERLSVRCLEQFPIN